MATIVMTGGSSGFGALAAAQLADDPDVRLLVGSRSPSEGATHLDLASLASVRRFAERVRAELGDHSIDALVLNAGLVQPDDTSWTVDGYERTFAVNHLAHYLLLRLLTPRLGDRARVVLTTSGTHHPATGASLATPRHADARRLARPETDPGRSMSFKQAGEEAYTASKLCTVLTARAFAAGPVAADRSVTTVAFDPGQVFGTGLARDLALPLRVAWRLMGTPVGAPVRALKPEMNTRPAAARALVGLVTGRERPPAGRMYAALRRGRLSWTDPSELALDDTVARRLWSDSADLEGLTD